jgi:hypothetical protein
LLLEEKILSHHFSHTTGATELCGHDGQVQQGEQDVFDDDAFDMALCLRLLSLYTTHLGEECHRTAIREMCRVGPDVRIFPLLALGATRSPFVDQAVDELNQRGLSVPLDNVP